MAHAPFCSESCAGRTLPVTRPCISYSLSYELGFKCCPPLCCAAVIPQRNPYEPMAAHQPCVSSLTIFQKATQSYSCCGLVRGQYEITGFSAFFLLLYRSVLNGEKIPPHERARRTEYWCTVFIHGGSVWGWAWCCMLGAPLNTTRGRAQLVVPACRAMWKCPGMCLPGSRGLWPQGNVLWVGLGAGTALLGAACASAGQPSLLYRCTGIFFSVA